MKTGLKFWKRALAVTVVFVVGISGGVAVASHGFSDVPFGNIFHDEIDFLAEREITQGCGGSNFCPKANVTREQMAAFLERTARALSPVVLTATEQGLTEDVNDCIIGPFTPDFEMVATFNGGVYAHGPGQVSSRVNYRADGGAWTDVTGAWYIPNEPAAGDFGGSPVVGYFDLEPNVSYQFSVDAANVGDGTSTGCQLTAIIHHRMPDELVIGLAAAAPQVQEDVDQ